MGNALSFGLECQRILVPSPDEWRVSAVEGGGRLGNIATQWAVGVGLERQRFAPQFLPRRQAVGRRAREMSWRMQHPEAFRAYAGEWVALEGEEIVAHGHALDRVIADARARGVRVPYVFRVEHPDDDVIQMGL